MADNFAVVGPVYNTGGYINLYYLNELYRKIALAVSEGMQKSHGLVLPLTAGIWGGTYLIANDSGVAKNRIQRLYCIVNMPREQGLEDKENLKMFMDLYSKTCAEALEPYGLALELEQWGDILPYSNRHKPSLIMHLSDANKTIRWLRLFFVWNVVLWKNP